MSFMADACAQVFDHEADAGCEDHMGKENEAEV